MKSYLVGGAVRDALLGLPVKDRDWVVVGATPQQMLDAAYLLLEAWEVAQSVSTKEGVAAGFKGAEIREELTRRRIAAVAQWKEQRCPQPQG